MVLTVFQDANQQPAESPADRNVPHGQAVSSRLLALEAHQPKEAAPGGKVRRRAWNEAVDLVRRVLARKDVELVLRVSRRVLGDKDADRGHLGRACAGIGRPDRPLERGPEPDATVRPVVLAAPLPGRPGPRGLIARRDHLATAELSRMGFRH